MKFFHEDTRWPPSNSDIHILTFQIGLSFSLWKLDIEIRLGCSWTCKAAAQKNREFSTPFKRKHPVCHAYFFILRSRRVLCGCVDSGQKEEKKRRGLHIATLSIWWLSHDHFHEPFSNSTTEGAIRSNFVLVLSRREETIYQKSIPYSCIQSVRSIAKYSKWVGPASCLRVYRSFHLLLTVLEWSDKK